MQENTEQLKAIENTEINPVACRNLVYNNDNIPSLSLSLSCIAENTIIKVKRQWQTERVLATYIMDSGLISNIWRSFKN